MKHWVINILQQKCPYTAKITEIKPGPFVFYLDQLYMTAASKSALSVLKKDQKKDTGKGY